MARRQGGGVWNANSLFYPGEGKIVLEVRAQQAPSLILTMHGTLLKVIIMIYSGHHWGMKFCPL